MDETNPFAKRTWNLTQQMILTKENPEKAAQMAAEAHFLDSEHERLKTKRSLVEFNKLTAGDKIKFIKNGGVVV